MGGVTGLCRCARDRTVHYERDDTDPRPTRTPATTEATWHNDRNHISIVPGASLHDCSRSPFRSLRKSSHPQAQYRGIPKKGQQQQHAYLVDTAGPPSQHLARFAASSPVYTNASSASPASRLCGGDFLAGNHLANRLASRQHRARLPELPDNLLRTVALASALLHRGPSLP